jgi:hypothetical protein
MVGDSNYLSAFSFFALPLNSKSTIVSIEIENIKN